MYRFLHPLEIESLPPWDPTTEDTLCTLESVKAVGEVYAPVDCEAWSWSPHVLLMKFEMVYKWCTPQIPESHSVHKGHFGCTIGDGVECLASSQRRM